MLNNILNNDIKYLAGVGPRRAGVLLAELGIATFEDMLYTFPFRYVDRTKFYTVGEITAEMPYIQLRGKIVRFQEMSYGRRQKRYTACFSDGTGTVELVFFQGLKFIREKLKLGVEYVVFGKPSLFGGKINLVHPEVDEPGAGGNTAQGVLQGVYGSSEVLQSSGLGQRAFQRLQGVLQQTVMDKIEETLPDYLIKRFNLLPLREALQHIHFPQSAELLQKAQRRLKFEELFYIQLGLLRLRNGRRETSCGFVFNRVGDCFNTCYGRLPFPLTGAQKRVIREIRKDMGSGKQMNRLLQGDVGSGKTLVALLCALIAADNGYQSCIMAPTEILAQQHFESIRQLLQDTPVKVGLLTGSTKKKERTALHAQLLGGELQLLIGTHALIEDAVQFRQLGLVVIDEQHRFGVEQRARLWSKSERPPHVLVMTATPIPRTLAMTLYGDLDVSVIDELPPGRQPVTTVHYDDSRRLHVFGFMKKQIKEGRQIYVVYPLIKESEKMDYKNLEDGYESITRAFPLPDYVTAIVHGQMPPENKQFDMQRFVRGQAHIMVATSVIEVGVNVPNATVMVIESAERFGLSQLHQLRGRVGRGAAQSYCVLMTGQKLSREARKRMQLLVATGDGFKIAEADLQQRGPGNLEGTQQSGLALKLHIADLAHDGQLMEYTRGLAEKILAHDPRLENKQNELLAVRLQQLRNREKDYSTIS